jgi:hypothetical protein
MLSLSLQRIFVILIENWIIKIKSSDKLFYKYISMIPLHTRLQSLLSEYAIFLCFDLENFE